MNPRSEETAKVVLDYLMRNPEAGDTLEGIARWWFKATDPRRSTDGVSRALKDLIQEGLAMVHETPNGEAIYRSGHTGRD